MNAELKAKWLAALRSGDYEQASSGVLREMVDGADRFCCLGVLVDVAKVGEWNLGAVYPDYLFGGRHQNGHLQCAAARLVADHPNAGDALGLEFQQCRKLAAMNDYGKSFAEIADYIEKTL